MNPKKVATKKSAQAGRNAKRSLEVIGAELRKLRNVFYSGELLTEAKDACEHGEFLPWLDTYYDASPDTAENQMAAYRLSLKFRNLRNLQVPTTIIYQLTGFEDDPDLPAIIEALVKATTTEKPLSVSDCNYVIDTTVARIKWGNDLPAATLDALEYIDKDAPWSAGAIEQLKRERPATDGAADKIVRAHQEKHAQTLSDDSPEEDEPVEEQDTAPPPKPAKPLLETKETSPCPCPLCDGTSHEQATAVAAVNNDIGIDSKAESERRQAVIDDLANERNKLKIALEGRDREVARLEGEIEKLKTEPKLSLNKLIDALVLQLRKLSREKQELTIEELQKKLALKPLVTSTTVPLTGKAALRAIADEAVRNGHPITKVPAKGEKPKKVAKPVKGKASDKTKAEAA